MFIGEYQHALDLKGRIFIPSKFREDLRDGFIITKGINGCLFIFTREEWTSFSQKLRTLPIANKEAQAFNRLFFAGASECDVDKQGRILIPTNLREYAKLDKDIFIIGVFSRVEIWSKDSWETYNNNSSDSYDSILEKMEELGI